MRHLPPQVPITFVDRIFGESKLGPGEIVGYVGARPPAAPVRIIAPTRVPDEPVPPPRPCRYLQGLYSLFVDL